MKKFLLIFILLIPISFAQMKIVLEIFPKIDFSILYLNTTISENEINQKILINNIGSIPFKYLFLHEIYQNGKLYALIKSKEEIINPSQYKDFNFEYFFVEKSNYTLITKIFYFSNLSIIETKNFEIKNNCNKTDLILFALKYKNCYFIKLKSFGTLILRNEDLLEEKVLKANEIDFCLNENFEKIKVNIDQKCDEEEIKNVSFLEFYFFKFALQIFKSLSFLAL